MKRSLAQWLGVEPTIDDRLDKERSSPSTEKDVEAGVSVGPLSEQLQRAQRMEMIGTLAGGLAHDLRNLLAPIEASADILSLDQLSDEARVQVLTIKRSTRRASELVAQMLSFSRGGGTELRNVQPGPVIDELGKFVRETFPRSIQVRISTRSELREIRSEPTQLLQILLNLCVNSRDAMPNGGTLTIVAENVLFERKSRVLPLDREPGEYVRISVIDTGTGMSQTVINRIFEPFFTTKPIGKGTGLGLSVVHGLVRSHNGFVTVNSTVGVGTDISVFFPGLHAGKPAKEERDVVKMPAVSAGKSLLLVEDDDVTRTAYATLLTRVGYKVQCATSGEEAIAIVAANTDRIDAVITDIMMPSMSGWDAIAKIQAIDPGKAIVAFSGCPRYHKAEFSDDVAFVQKPASGEEIIFSIEESIRQARLRSVRK